ncbi:BRCA1-associated RING domain protein 1 [Synchiropus splendidus]|uniref:BRCA1-associated RING domain protein 1 n=1 Tax=Synchiropus splendidus TaxID=270530 RepID=UPI00237E91FA|nr:BRCA1-associated RING domain protein 1 [Synchiropus splendidus]
MTDGNVQTSDWKHMRKAVEDFRQLLLCAKCSNLMTEPVCLGRCEHLLCRSCAGSQAGDGCAVCHSPAWVKDIQINRQLSSIIQRFTGLESLLKPVEQPASPAPEIPMQTERAILKHKKNFKIWFSPRSRKVRCKVEKPADVPDNSEEIIAPQQQSSTRQNKSLSVFNFTCSSQDSELSPSCGDADTKNKKKKVAAKRNYARRKKPVQAKKPTGVQATQRNLDDINKQWGFGQKANPAAAQPCAEDGKKSGKRVCFQSPAAADDLPQQGSLTPNPGFDTSPLKNQTQLCQSTSESAVQSETPSPKDIADDAEKPKGTSKPQNVTKRSKVKDKVAALETTPKRSRSSPVQRRISQGRMSPSVLNLLSVTSPGCGKKRKDPHGDMEESSSLAGVPSPSTSARLLSGSPLITRKNYKGETLLHLAAIKGDVGAVTELLDQGADPNLKDNAGWTPLHEACNLGHLPVVEELVLRGALLNTPGYENDSPLHDAVRNGHVAIVKVLLRLGASQNVLNLHGKRAVDYAATPEMLEIFNEASRDDGDPNNTSLNTTVTSVSLVGECVKRDAIVFLPSKLSQTERGQLAKLGQLLEGRTADTFSGSVSHVIVPEGPMPTTISTLLGLLAGCWIVKFSWVEACLQAGKWEPESEHEAGDGPQRSRMNKCSLLPPLFDGCFFFLLGSFKSPAREELTRLLQEGGGQLLRRQPKPDSDVTQTLNAAAYHALPGSDQELCTQYIIFDPKGPHKPVAVRRGKVWSAPSSWIISCITAFCLLPVPDS